MPPRPRPTWPHPGLIIALLVLFPPAGILLVWLSDWERQKKIAATIISGVWFVIILAVGPSDDEETEDTRANPTPTPTVTAEATDAETNDEVEVPDLVGLNLTAAIQAADEAGFDATSHDATEDDAGQWDNDNWTVCFQTPQAGTDAAPQTTIELAVIRNGSPCPESDGVAIEYPQMPDVIGMTFNEASSVVADLEVTDISADAAYLDVELPERHDAWTVCFQDPAAGDEIINPANESVELSLVEPDTACPADESSELHPDPTPNPEPNPDPDPDAGSLGGSGGSDDDDDDYVYYANCDEARAAGAAPLSADDPGYRSELDRDGDGIACDS